MSRLKSLRRQVRKLQASQIPDVAVFIVNDEELIEKINSKAKENVFIVDNVDTNCMDCSKHYSDCDCRTSNNGSITEEMYQFWKENDPKHYERLVKLKDQDENKEMTKGLEKWIKDGILHVRKKRVNGQTETIEKISLSQLSIDMKEVLCKGVVSL